MDKFLTFLQWKKSALAAIIMTIIAYCAAKGYLGTEEVTMVGAITTIVFGSASYETKIMNMKSSQATTI